MLSTLAAVFILQKACVATSPSSWRSCVAAANAGTTKRIEVRAPITCTTWEPCDVTLSGVNGVTITGVAGTGSALRRRAYAQAPLIAVSISSNVTISDLVIDEDAAFQCLPVNPDPPFVENPDCPHSILIYGSTTVNVWRNTLLRAPKVAVRVIGGDDIDISDNKIIDSRLFGAQIDGVPQLAVVGNLFHRGASNALVLSGVHPPGTARAYVMNNFFVHNHRHNMYWSCGANGDEPCGGGQLLLYGELSRLSITGNVFRDGWSEDFPGTTVSAVGGIEINSPNIVDVWFGYNSVHDHSGWGISVNPNPVGVAGLELTDNEWWGNGTAPYYDHVDVHIEPGLATYANNCTWAGCQGISAGAIYADPNPCVIAAGYSKCKSKLVWLSNDLYLPSLSSGSTLLSNAPDGETTTSLPAGSYDYQLRDDAFFPSLPVATMKLVVR